MRRPSIALFSGIGRRVALGVLASGLLVVVAGLALQTGKQQRQYREMHQQQLRQAAAIAVVNSRSRLYLADAVLRSFSDSGAKPLSPSARIAQASLFNWRMLVPVNSAGLLQAGLVKIKLSGAQMRTLAGGRTLLVSAESPASGASELFLVQQPENAPPAQLLVAQLSREWLWAPLGEAQADIRLVAIDSDGSKYFGALQNSPNLASMFAGHLPEIPKGGPVTPADLSWNAQGSAWVGALARIEIPASSAVVQLAIVAVDQDRPLAVAFWSALRTQSALLGGVLLMAALAGQIIGMLYQPTFRSLRRALVHLPQRQGKLALDGRSCAELTSLVEAFNRASVEIAAQRETQGALEEIDALLLVGGDYESVVDQILMRVREATGSNNVGLMLVDPAMTGHGRLFAVNASGGCPVNRVLLDEQMAQVLAESASGMTVVRCEEVRHSFLLPLQQAGSEFFWIWPVLVNGPLAAVLAIGYAEAPEQGNRVVICGTQCARRLGIALSSTTRADKLYRQAHFDPLTQLPNRLLFRDRLAQELASNGQSPARGALLYIDLDHFKKVNDSHGHAAGDQLLSVVAQRLRSCVKEGDTVARLGGDEFSVILRQANDAAAASAVAERIIQSMNLPVRIGNVDHLIHASIGVTLFPDDGTQLEELLRNADLAMYRAKDMGRGTAMFFNAKMTTRAGRVADSGLYRALKRREFSLFYQPQYCVADGSLLGVEALLRWQKPRDGLLCPADFVPAAEESGLIVDLGGWVLEAACVQIAQWREAGLPVPRMAVNLSVQQLRDTGLVTDLRRVLERFRIAPASIEFELNEAALVDPESQSCLVELSALGVGLTLDDFGTGHTALGNLRRHPVGKVKIDRSIVDELAVSASAAAMTSTLIVMAHSLDKLVVAEGVETIEQLDFLRERGCDMAQGYFLARPLAAADMTELLQGRQTVAVTERSATA
jgi:diguanylate cyclase (GGDEF)-like protein